MLGGTQDIIYSRWPPWPKFGASQGNGSSVAGRGLGHARITRCFAVLELGLCSSVALLRYLAAGLEQFNRCVIVSVCSVALRRYLAAGLEQFNRCVIVSVCSVGLRT